MTNTGTWNSDFALFFMFVFFSPVILYFLLGVALKIFEMHLAASSQHVLYIEQPQPIREPQKTKQKPEPNQDDQMYLDAIAGLSGLGYKKSEARRIISKARSEKDYENAEDIISDVISSVYK